MDVGRMVNTQIVSGESHAPPELLAGINDGSVPLLGVVKALGDFLTSTEDSVRTRGLTFLTHVLSNIDKARVNRQATQVLTNFYCDKLDDANVVPPALQALAVLAKLPTFGDGDSTEVYKAVVENVKMRSYVQSTRYLVFTLVDAIMAHHRNALKKMGPDFINSYVKLVEGEKDPRNLMLLFSIGRVILIEFDISAHVEDLFDVTFCYFPITFKPPPDDPYGITADDLKKALRLCMAATPKFAPMALPLFLEKMGTALGPSMRDTLQSMAACFPVYGALAVQERSKELWEAIKTEIYYSPDAGIEADALAAAESLLQTLYPGTADSAEGLASDIVKECLELLNEPDKSKAMAATKVLASFIRSSPLLSAYALSQALPHLFKMFNEPSLPSHRSPILATISSLVLAARGVYVSGSRSQAEERSLSPFREPLIDVLREGLRTEGLKSAAVRGTVALIEIPGFLDKGEIEAIVDGINGILVDEEDDALRDTAVQGLITVSTLFPAAIETLTLPVLFHALPDTAPNITAVTEREHYRSIIASLTKLCVQPSLFETLVVRVTSKLELLSMPVSADEDVDMEGGEVRDAQRECTVAYGYALLHCLLSVTKAKLEAKHVDLPKYFDKLVPRLFSLAVSALRTDAPGDALFLDRRLLEISAKIIEVFTWTISEERQSRFANDLIVAFETGDWSRLVLKPADAVGVVIVPPFQAGAAPAYQNMVVFFSAGMAALRPTAALATSDSNQLLSSLLDWTLEVADDTLQIRAVLTVLASLVNKRTPDVQGFIGARMDEMWNADILNEASNPERRRKAILAWMFVTRGLLLRSDPAGYTFLAKIFELFKKSEQTGIDAARSFTVWSEGEKEAANAKQNHLVVRLLHKQKFFNVVLPQIIDGYKQSSKDGQAVYLVALAALIPTIPTSLCISELSSLLPLLLRSLTLQDPELRANVIEALGPIVETEDASASEIIHSQSPTMIDLLLKNAQSLGELTTSARCRTASLKALSVFPDAIRYEVLHPQKSKVVRGLAAVLDDKKRTVRKEAVDTRSKWIKLGGAAA